jgi:hypothetical protein
MWLALCAPHKKASAHSTPQNAGEVIGVMWSHHLPSADWLHTRAKSLEEMLPVTCWHNSTQDTMPELKVHCYSSQTSLRDPTPQLSNSRSCLEKMRFCQPSHSICLLYFQHHSMIIFLSSGALNPLEDRTVLNNHVPECALETVTQMNMHYRAYRWPQQCKKDEFRKKRQDLGMANTALLHAGRTWPKQTRHCPRGLTYRSCQSPWR